MELAQADLPHLDGSLEEARAGAAAINDFGLDAYRALVAGSPDDDLVMSPASIALALAMARAGARGKTADEMDAVLHQLGSDDHAAWVAAIDEALEARTGRFPDLNGEPQDVTLSIVNAPFSQRGLQLQPAYLEALATRFGAGLRLVDYVNATEDARLEINRWVAEQTERRIEELLEPGVLDGSTRLVLTNAIYLKAAWLTPFEEAATVSEPFTRLDGSTVDVPMMHADATVRYGSGAGWAAVDLPYVGSELSMIVIMPDDLAGFEASLDGATLDTLVTGLGTRRVALALPRFGVETKAELKPLLSALGMPTAFGDAADFSGMTREAALQIAAVVHQANIDVDEAGTEAAAATAVVMRETSAAVADVEFTVNRPFMYALRDRETGTVLFLGRVTEPRERGG
jgi:serpin B